MSAPFSETADLDPFSRGMLKPVLAGYTTETKPPSRRECLVCHQLPRDPWRMV
jgi:hypothetical protein